MSTSEPVFKEDDKCVALADVRWDEYAWDKLVHELCSTITSIGSLNDEVTRLKMEVGTLEDVIVQYRRALRAHSRFIL